MQKPEIPKKPQMTRKQQIIAGVIGGVSAVVSGHLVQHGTAMYRKANLEKDLIVFAEATNKTLPKKVDEETQFDAVKVGPGKRIAYMYTLLKYSSGDVDPKMFTERVRDGVVQRGCESREFRLLLDNDVIAEYIYRANDSAEVVRFEVSAKNCDGFKMVNAQQFKIE